MSRVQVHQQKDRLSEWIKRHSPTIGSLQEIYFKYKNKYRLKINGWRKIYHVNTNQKKAGTAILISDRKNYKRREVIKNKEGYYIMKKESVLQEDIITLSMNAPNNRASHYMRQKWIEAKRNR